jgi:hypothetical protein
MIAGVVALTATAALIYRLTRPDPEPETPREPPWFIDVTDDWGITFRHEAGPLTDYWMPRINGSGVAIFDFDGDDKLDLYFLTFGGPDSPAVNRLYKNLGNGKFTDVTEGSGLGIAGYNTGVIVGDLDNDGRPDLVVTQYNGARVFRNLGNGKFKDATAGSGVRNPLWAASANLLDYDRDGRLDLLIVNYVDYQSGTRCPDLTGRPEYCGPQLFAPTVSKLFHNLGSENGQLRFQDVTVEAGLASAPGPGLGVYCADFNNDGWTDIFIANDLKPNHLWMNQKNGTFREEAYLHGIAADATGQTQSGMGIAAGDINNDGLFDIFVTHLASEKHTLWMQGPTAGAFADRTAASGLLESKWRATGWGASFTDFDRDGWLDLAIANGSVTRQSEEPEPSLGEHFQRYGQRNQIFRNDGSGRFIDLSESNPALCGTRNLARGLAVGDLDGDGAPDLVITGLAQRARVYRNVSNPSGRGVRIRAVDPRYRRDAYGAEVTLLAAGRRQLRILNPGDSFQSSSDPAVCFGLGDATSYDGVEIRWPDGARTVHAGGPAGGTRVITRPEKLP